MAAATLYVGKGAVFLHGVAVETWSIRKGRRHSLLQPSPRIKQVYQRPSLIRHIVQILSSELANGVILSSLLAHIMGHSGILSHLAAAIAVVDAGTSRRCIRKPKVDGCQRARSAARALCSTRRRFRLSSLWLDTGSVGGALMGRHQCSSREYQSTSEINESFIVDTLSIRRVINGRLWRQLRK